jgi:hypothetical protein
MAKTVVEYLDKLYVEEAKPVKRLQVEKQVVSEIEKCKEGYRWCPITKKCIPDTDNKGKGRRQGRGEGKGPMGKPTKEQVDAPEKETTDDKVVDEGVAGDVAKTAASIAAPMVGGAVGGMGGAIAASTATQVAMQALAKRKAMKAAQAKQQSGASKTDEKYQQLAAQRA